MANFNAVLDVQFTPKGVELDLLVKVKEWLKIEVTDEDTLLTTLITTGRQLCEGFTGLNFITKDVVAILNNSCGNIYLPYSPVTSAVVLKDADDNVITSPTVRGLTSKWIAYPISDYIKAEYTAGYSALPSHLETALLTAIAYLYEHRGDEETGKLSPMAMDLLTPYRAICF